MEPVTFTGIAILITAGVIVDLTTHAIRNSLSSIWHALRGGKRATLSDKDGAKSEEQRARKRVATRLMMLGGQFDTLGHWLTHLNSVTRIERVLVDIERLAEEHSHADLDTIGDADLGKVVIAYYRDVRGAIETVRDLARSYTRCRAMPNVEQVLETSLTQAQAYAGQCAREGKELGQKLKS